MNKEENINLISLFNNLYRYKWHILLIMLSTLIVTFFYIKQMVPIYASHILISVDNDKSSSITSLFPNNNVVNIDMESQLEYDIQILKSRNIISNVLKKVDLSKRFFIERKWGKEEIYKEKIPFNLEYKPKIKDGGSLLLFITEVDSKRFMISEGEESESNKRIYHYKQNIVTDNYTLKIKKKLSKASLVGKEYSIEVENNKNVLIAKILNNLSIEKRVNNLLDISYQDEIPQRAKDILTELVLSYKKYNLQTKQLKNRKNITFFNEMIADMEKILKKTGDELKVYRAKHKELLLLGSEDKFFFNTLEKKKNLLQLKKTLEALELTKNNIKNGIYSSSLLDINNLKTNEISTLIEKLRNQKEKLSLLFKQKEYPSTLLIENVSYERLLSQLKEEEKKLGKLTLEYTKEYTTVVETKKIIQQIKSELFRYLDNNIKNSFSEINQLKVETKRNIRTLIISLEKKYYLTEASLKEEQKTLDTLPTTTMRLKELERVFELNNNNKKKLQQRKSEALIAKKSTISNIHIVDNATTPKHPIKPKKSFLYLSGLILGLILSIAYSSLQIYREPKIYNKKDAIVEGYTLIYEKNTKDQENFWTLISHLENVKCNQSKKILITSSDYGENKNLVTIKLALHLANISKKILIIDFDIYYGVITQHFKKKNSMGLSTLLTTPHPIEEVNIEEYIDTLTTTIDFLPAGPIIPHCSTLLFNPNISFLLEKLSNTYDYILLATPPMGKHPQISILLKYIDILMVVAKIEKTDKKLLQNFNRENNFKIKNFIFLTDKE